jgi:hypothetical protein
MERLHLARMTATEIQKLQRATPFHPYRIHIAGGRTVRVPHPDFLAISPTGRTATAYWENGEIEIMDIFLISDLAVEEPASPEPPASNGEGTAARG